MRKLVVIEITALRDVFTADVEHRDGGIGQIGFGWIAAFVSDKRLGEKNGAGQEVVYMGTARMCQNRFSIEGSWDIE